MKNVYWLIDLIGDLEDVKRETYNEELENKLDKCIKILDQKIKRNLPY